jgi:hypothetical protein
MYRAIEIAATAGWHRNALRNCQYPKKTALHDRTQSPVVVSRKREYFNKLPETFDDFVSYAATLGVWRPPAELQKPTIGGLFCDC